MLDKVLEQTLPQVLYKAEQVRSMDQAAINGCGITGITLMRRAAKACVDLIAREWPELSSALIYCGAGNNAGDGYIIAAMLAERNIQVSVEVLGDVEKLSADGQTAYRYAQQSGALLEPCSAEIPEAELVIDALLGIGLSGTVRPHYQAVIDAINLASCPVLAVDIPSGLCADTGLQLGRAIRADHTVSFIGLKRGLFTLDGPDCAGQVHFSGLACPAHIGDGLGPTITRLSHGELLDKLGRRPKNAHKNSFGHILVIGGDQGMGGAAAMSALAAMRSGAGLVSVATHASHSRFVLANHPEIMVHGLTNADPLPSLITKASVLVLGPGLGDSSWSKEIFKVAVAADLPMVVDADGLNLLVNKSYKGEWVLTPHPGEAKRLLGGANVQDDRFTSVQALQKQYGGVVLLKGVGTLIADAAGTSLCPFGNPGMSTAGMGDILSGIIAALIAQGLGPMAAAELAVVVHAKAADESVEINGERGLMATDLLPSIRRLLNYV